MPNSATEALALFRKQAKANTLKGKLYLSSSGWLLLSVPNAIGRGLFYALQEPGAELPLSDSTGQYNAHVSVMRDSEVEEVGARKLVERGNEYEYSLGPIESFNPSGWSEMDRCWTVQVGSPDLEKLRKSYGLPPLPVHPDTKKETGFHVTFAVRRAKVLGDNEVTKGQEAQRVRASNGEGSAIALTDKPGTHVVKASEVRHILVEGAEIMVPRKPKEAKDDNGRGTGQSPAAVPHGTRLGDWGNKEAADGGLRRDVTLGQAVYRAARKAVAPKSKAQADAGNYRKGHVNMHGLNITIETPKGAKRSGTDKDGKKWEVEMQHHYGYIRRSQDADGDHCDVFIGPEPQSELVFIVDQIDPKTKVFDEHKIMLGFKTKADAKAAYLANYEVEWKGLGKISPLAMHQFKEWLKDGSQIRPVSTQTFKVKAAATEKGRLSPDDQPGIMILQKSTTIRIIAPHKQPRDEEGHFEKKPDSLKQIDQMTKNLRMPVIKGLLEDKEKHALRQ
jgi:hypothetical protein